MAAATGKKVFWGFDPNTSIMSVDQSMSNAAALEAVFSFELEVYKDSDTHVESMKITNYKNDIENGYIVTSIVDLEKDIKGFKRFGVVIGDTYYRDLAKRIEEVYPSIKINEVVLSGNDTRLVDLLEQVKIFVEECNDYITGDFCYIPVNMFNGLASDCGFSDYEIKSLRSQLAQDKYIHVVSGRYAILKRLGNKPERAVAFYREKLGVEMPIKATKKQAEKSGKDE